MSTQTGIVFCLHYMYNIKLKIFCRLNNADRKPIQVCLILSYWQGRNKNGKRKIRVLKAYPGPFLSISTLKL